MSIPVSAIRPFPADRERPSPNHGPRTARHVSLIVLHATAGSDEGAESWMANPDSNVSAHLHIRRDGSVTRQVADERRAWHAGRSSWPGIGDVNSESLGWEIGHLNDPAVPYTDAQYETVAELLRWYLPQGLGREDVTDHASVAPGRKTDPAGWDWARMWRLVDRTMAPEPADDAPTLEWPDAGEPDVALVGAEWTPEPLDTLTPVEALRSPVRAVSAVTAEQDETVGDWLCRISGWALSDPQLVARLPWWIPVPVLKRGLEHVFGCR